MKLLTFLWRTSRRSVVIASLASVGSGISSTGLIVLTYYALHHSGSAVAALVWGFVGLCGIYLLSGVLAQQVLITLSQGTIYELRMRMSRQVLATPLRTLETIGAPRLLATLTDDITHLAEGLLGIPALSVQFMIVGSALACLGWLSWKLLAAVAVFMVVAIASYQILAACGLSRLRVARKEQDRIFEHFRALTQGAKELKLHADRRTAFFGKLFGPSADASRRQSALGLSFYMGASYWGYLMFFVLLGLSVFWFPSLFRLETQTVIGGALILLYMKTPLEAIFSWLPLLGRADVALAKIEELGISLTAGEVEEPSRAGALGPGSLGWGRIDLSGVVHRYRHDGEDGQFTLGPIDLSVCPGEVLFLTGGNGCGKSTLAKVLTGLYVPEAGEISVDGTVVTDKTREQYRQTFSAVFSDFYLFERLLGISRYDVDARTRELLAQLQLSHKVSVADGVLSTIDLSTGQRKRLALLTAYLEDRPCYVFDEWAADQDPVFKEIFYTQILPELKRRGKAVVCITHDDRFFRVADRVIKLDYGQVVADERRVAEALQDDPYVITSP